MIENKIEICDVLPIDSETYQVNNTEHIIIFGEKIQAKHIIIRCGNEFSLTDKLESINLYLTKLIDFKEQLINFYNLEFEDNAGKLANDDWYKSLEIFRLTLIIGQDGNIYADVVVGDTYLSDHLLDLELGKDGVLSMQYDG